MCRCGFAGNGFGDADGHFANGGLGGGEGESGMVEDTDEVIPGGLSNHEATSSLFGWLVSILLARGGTFGTVGHSRPSWRRAQEWRVAQAPMTPTRMGMVRAIVGTSVLWDAHRVGMAHGM